MAMPKQDTARPPTHRYNPFAVLVKQLDTLAAHGKRRGEIWDTVKIRVTWLPAYSNKCSIT